METENEEHKTRPLEENETKFSASNSTLHSDP